MDAARLFAALLKPVATALTVATVSGGLVFGVRALSGEGGPPPLIDVGGGTPYVVYGEFGDLADTFFAAPADNLAAKQAIASAVHAPGFGANAALSPDGRRIAYTALPPDTPRPSAAAPAELRVVESGAAPRLLASGADLLVPPVWAPDGHSVVIRRSEPTAAGVGTFRLARVYLDGGKETILVTDDAGLFPIAFTPDGASLYYARISPAGTDLLSVPSRGGDPVAVAHLSDDVARDWRLSPDGSRLTYLVQVLEGDRYTFVARVLDLAGDGLGGLDALNRSEAGAADEFGPVWWPDGSKVVLGRVRGEPAAPARIVSAATGDEEPVGQLDRGFDVPLSVAPSGEFIAVRSFKEGTPLQPGPNFVEIVGPEGRLALSDRSDVAVLGWLQR